MIRGVRMIRFDEWVFPAGEAHLQQWMRSVGDRVDGRLTYQGSKYRMALKHCRQRRVAVDVGGHVGLWSWMMARDFADVHAFEPMAAHRACWQQNVTAPHARLYAYALGAAPGRVDLVTEPTSSGDTRVKRLADDAGVELRTLDSFDLPIVDFLKIDCEGYEVFVLEGARETVARCRPTIIVEQKPGHAQRFARGERDACDLLTAMGAACVGETQGDFIFSFPEIH